ncbi:4Fe-4S binding protein [Dehalobacter sp. DCM]|uniref:4Fe-4S binding protein n=1 Tax=Dehalobacter sp. DCM TaxID=2907827 RepID=UPI003081C2FC|nr:4Fe-4S binding protein [Dehalobacter sp. DCM]
MAQKPVFVPKPKGLGLRNWIVDKIAATPRKWNVILKLFKLIVIGSKLTEKPIIGPLYKRIMMFSPVDKTYTFGTVLNLNVDVSDATESVTVPADLMKKLIREATTIVSANSCLCKDAMGCETYPHDVCCLFLGKGSLSMVKHDVGHVVSVEEALARVDKAAELGLIGQALWVELEQYVWGVNCEDLDKFIEVCFCCPCCCVGLNVAKNASREIKERFRSSGWQAQVQDHCIGCGFCVESCVQSAITIKNGKAVVNETYCMGCGICKTHCQQGAIKIEQVKPMRASVQEYFLEEGRLDIKP